MEPLVHRDARDEFPPKHREGSRTSKFVGFTPCAVGFVWIDRWTTANANAVRDGLRRIRSAPK